MGEWRNRFLYMKETNKDITPYNEKGKPHGYWERYWIDEQLWYKGNYINGLQYGWWEWYYINGKLEYKGNFKKGTKIGLWEWYDGEIDFYI